MVKVRRMRKLKTVKLVRKKMIQMKRWMKAQITPMVTLTMEKPMQMKTFHKMRMSQHFDNLSIALSEIQHL